MTVKSFDSANEIAELLDRMRPDAIITDIRMPGVSGLDLLSVISNKAPEIPVIITTAHTDLESAVASYRGGAFEYLPKPFDVDEAVSLVRRASRTPPASTPGTGLDPGTHAGYHRRGAGDAGGIPRYRPAVGIESERAAQRRVRHRQGTGGARAAQPQPARRQIVHRHQYRRDSLRELLESELFGHEKGAFTGAVAARKGRFEQANGGTLFLDEIGDMPPVLQTRLLRVLQDGRFYRVGGHEQVETNVRIVAATNQNLEQRVKEGRFREDLFHRLNVIRIHLPPLRERREDIPALARHFIKRSATELSVEAKRLAPEAEEYLSHLPWPGNVRQIENTCRWLTVMAPGQVIRVEDLPPELRQSMQDAVVTDSDWEARLRLAVDQRLLRGDADIFRTSTPVSSVCSSKPRSGKPADASRMPPSVSAGVVTP